MEMFDVMIVAAGNGTRMGQTNVPKILTEVNGKPNLWNTLDKFVGCPVGRIYIVVNHRNYEAINKSINEYINKDGGYVSSLVDAIKIIQIQSGRGDGHAVLEAYKRLKTHTQWMFIMWGDAFITSSDIFNDCVREYSVRFNEGVSLPSMFIPVINEVNPYVTFIVSQHMECISADFSKRGEQHPSGFHDQCIFFCDMKVVIPHLETLENAYFKNGRYITDSGELTFLYLVHYLCNIGNSARAIITDSPVLSYNTQGEVKEIEKTLSNKQV
jgi:bifunctional N-acetylglucosamine-1-phosphate-uridyltransferase/glucosamine-1-phosphate-acetyltransferase GlmU-like protein